jgi:hypothetical protein
MYTKSDSIAKLAVALAKAQAVIKPALKTSRNPHLGNRYADLSEVMGACLPALSANGLSVLQPVTADGGKVTVTTLLLHESGEWVSSDITLQAYEQVKGSGFAVSDKPQALGSAITYGRRYALSSMVGVVADEDDDGNSASAVGPAPAKERLDWVSLIDGCKTKEDLEVAAEKLRKNRWESNEEKSKALAAYAAKEAAVK